MALKVEGSPKEEVCCYGSIVVAPESGGDEESRRIMFYWDRGSRPLMTVGSYNIPAILRGILYEDYPNRFLFSGDTQGGGHIVAICELSEDGLTFLKWEEVDENDTVYVLSKQK